ncbi:MAG TPA: nucleoside deaminase [Haploplasma sp.]|nr:nucleoside deaminase [Haploplasma sp.]
MDKHLYYLNEAVNMAKEALLTNNSPFGSILVLDDQIIFKDHNRISNGDNTNHPEFTIAKYAATNLTIEERKRAIVYTSGEHCPMCAAAHGWVELGLIVYAFSSKQLSNYYDQLKVTRGNVRTLPINEVINNTQTIGPFLEFEEEIKKLHFEYLTKTKAI